MTNDDLANMGFFRFPIAVLITVLGLASCGGDGEGDSPSNPSAPSVTLSAGATSIAYSASTTITWTSTNATSCTSSSGAGGTGTSGSFSTGALTATTTYSVTCTGTGGSASDSATITVTPPAITGVSDAGSGNVTIISNNDLTTGTAIVISGTTNYDGTYTIVSATSVGFVITHAYVANDTTGSWQRAGGMISGCSTIGDTNAITLSTIPSRFTGVAPLSVFFDAGNTTATTTIRPFHDLEYHWDFGDPAGSPVSGATWSTGSRPNVSSRNAASGPVAGHVFETPGAYTIGLMATDGVNTVSNNCAQIVVQDPDTVFADTNTICFSTSANYTDCPSGATHVQSSNFTIAINSYQAANHRLLFRRGETFTGSASGVINTNGPGIIGAYGSVTDPKPFVVGPGTSSVIELARGSTGDWRIMDLALNGQSTIDGANVGVGATGPFDTVTLLRLEISGVHSGIAASHWALVPGDTNFDQWTIQDSTVTGIPGCNWPAHYECNWRIYIVGTRWSIQGNYLDGQSNPTGNTSGGSHVFRSESMANSILGNNTMAGAGYFQHVIKLHAWAWGGGAGGNSTPGVYTEKIIISDNKIVGGINPWAVSLGAQDEINDERVRDIIVERNWFTAGSGTQVPMHISSSQTTLRNNICDLTGAAWHTCAIVDQWGITPAPSDVGIYNNTFYSGPANDFVGVEIGTASNTIVQNNLLSAPAAANPEMIVGTGSGLIQSNNLLNNTPSALFISASPAVPADFALKALPNPARDSGLSSVPVRSDFFLSTRPLNGVIDIGAVEGP